MWPMKKSKASIPGKVVKRLVTGLIIGGAIGSVVGKHLLDKHEKQMGNKKEEEDDGSSVD